MTMIYFIKLQNENTIGNLSRESNKLYIYIIYYIIYKNKRTEVGVCVQSNNGKIVSETYNKTEKGGKKKTGCLFHKVAPRKDIAKKRKINHVYSLLVEVSKKDVY